MKENTSVKLTAHSDNYNHIGSDDSSNHTSTEASVDNVSRVLSMAQSTQQLANLPKHIAIIMDGNNRYATARAMPKGQGHVVGKDALDPIVEYCLQAGIEVLTVFAFSSENWQRPSEEVALLMRLLSATIYEQMPRMDKYRIRLRFIGDRSQLSADLQALMADAEGDALID